MKYYPKYSILVFFFLFVNSKLSAQAIPFNDSTYYHNLSFMVKGGINHAPVNQLSTNFTTTINSDVILHRLLDVKTNIGYQYGIGIKYQLNRRIVFQSGIDLIEHSMSIDYEERYFNDTIGLRLKKRGVFEQNQFNVKIPLIVEYLLGKKIKWHLGAGIYWLFPGRKVTGFWDHTDTRFKYEKNGELWETIKIGDGRTREQFVLPLQMNNLGVLLQAQLIIPLSWNVEVLISSQYHREFKALPPPSISRPQFIFETGFRFRLKYH